MQKKTKKKRKWDKNTRVKNNVYMAFVGRKEIKRTQHVTSKMRIMKIKERDSLVSLWHSSNVH